MQNQSRNASPSIVPVYFNEGSLPPLFRELQDVERQLLALGVELELIFVDDGSGDGSFARTGQDQGRPAGDAA